MIEVDNVEGTSLQVINLRSHEDDRGQFGRIFCETLFPDFAIKQSNISITDAVGTVRGMHFQRFPSRESKIVVCLSGRVFDVVVNIRENSPDYLKWYGFELSGGKQGGAGVAGLVIPEGYAHGFQVLEKKSTLIYFHNDMYRKDLDMGLNPLDPDLGIDWPLDVGLLSERDRSFALVSDSRL